MSTWNSDYPESATETHPSNEGIALENKHNKHNSDSPCVAVISSYALIPEGQLDKRNSTGLSVPVKFSNGLVLENILDKGNDVSLPVTVVPNDLELSTKENETTFSKDSKNPKEVDKATDQQHKPDISSNDVVLEANEPEKGHALKGVDEQNIGSISDISCNDVGLEKEKNNAQSVDIVCEELEFPAERQETDLPKDEKDSEHQDTKNNEVMLHDPIYNPISSRKEALSLKRSKKI